MKSNIRYGPGFDSPQLHGNSELKSIVNSPVIDLINDILDNKEVWLDDLLICDAASLKEKNSKIVTKYNLENERNFYLLKLAFDYEIDSVSSVIRDFFRSNNFVKYCPYCNLVEVNYSSTDGGRSATTHQLDHFFDKATHPLLSYSFFNLIPSDYTCNCTNKGTIEFTDEYHLNPYIDGFAKKMVFKPILCGKKVDRIDVEIRAKRGTQIRKQMLGSTEEINEDVRSDGKHKEGNVNVFTLITKYKNREEEAQDVLDSIYKVDKGMRAIKRLLDTMRGVDINEVYKKWYKSDIKTPFEENKFNTKALSKFNRDIHDYYYNQIDSNPRNNYIRKMI